MNLFQEIADAAEKRRIEFLLIGGNAVNAYGYSRLTADIDLLVRRSDQDDWISLLQELGYELHHTGSTFLQFRFTRTPGQLPLDLMLVNDQTFAKLAAGSRPATIEGTELRIPSLPHLIALKLHAISQNLAHRTLKDFLDVVELVALNKLDLHSPEMTEILNRYATEDLRHRLLVACDQQHSRE